MKIGSLGYWMVITGLLAVQMACVKSILETAWPYRELLLGLWRGMTR